jgi:hypothetical protein
VATPRPAEELTTGNSTGDVADATGDPPGASSTEMPIEEGQMSLDPGEVHPS